MENRKCIKCDGQMEEGIIIDFAHGGVPYTSKWTNQQLKGSRLLSDKTSVELEIKSLRCTSCGYLESYACQESS